MTNSLATQQAIQAIAESRSQLDNVMARLTTGKRVAVASDDPSAALGIMQNEAQLRARGQHLRSIDAATVRVNLQDSALGLLSNLLERARELAISQGSDTATPETRRAAGREVEQLLADAVQLGATRIDNEYLFGGVRTDAAPFSLDHSTAPPTVVVATPAPVGTRSVEIAAGQRFTATHDGLTVFGDDTTGPLAALQRLATAMASGSGAEIRDSVSIIDAAHTATTALVAETGGRANQLQRMAETHNLMRLELTAAISELRDVELEEVLTELAGRQMAYEAAMAATAQLARLSLTDYLR